MRTPMFLTKLHFLIHMNSGDSCHAYQQQNHLIFFLFRCLGHPEIMDSFYKQYYYSNMQKPHMDEKDRIYPMFQ